MTDGMTAASTTGNPQKAGMCPRCGGQLYAGLTHVCTTGVRSAATIPEWAGTPIVSFGLVVSPMPRSKNDRLLYAEVVPAGSRWLPWPGRTSRWWFEVHAQHAPDEHGVTGTTYAYIEGGSGGAFTLRGCIAKAMEAVDKFVWEDTDDAE